MQVTPCKNRPNRGSLFCRNHQYDNGWDGMDHYEILSTSSEDMEVHLNAIGAKTKGTPAKTSTRTEVIKVSGENVLDEKSVREYNLQIYNTLRGIGEPKPIFRLISNHPTAYHLNRACYDFRLMLKVISVMAEKDDDLCEAELVEKFGLFLTRKCHGKLSKCDSSGRPCLCNKLAMRGDMFCERHSHTRPGYSADSSLADIYLQVWNEGYRHFSDAASKEKRVRQVRI